MRVLNRDIKILDLYLGTRVIRGFLLITLVLVCLFSFLELAAQLGDVGKGNYELMDAFIFVGLTLPRRILDLMPISTLLGSIVALGLMADHKELLAMQAGGMSVQRICLAVIAAGTLLILTTGLLAEFVVPPLEQKARTRRALALSDTGVTLTDRGFWARQGRSYIHVRETLYGGTATGLDIFELDDRGHLRSYSYARGAKIQDDDQWVLEQITQKGITEDGISTRYQPRMVLGSFLSSDQVTVLELPPDSLSSTDLHQYIRALKDSGQNADRYVLALWRKFTVPLTTGAMVLLSLPFIFATTRGTTAGQRIMMGSIVGIGLYLADQIIGHLGLLLSVKPLITALIPVVMISGIALWRLRQTV